MQRFSLTVTAKGQFTLPVEARELMNVAPGDRMELFVTRDGASILRARNKPASAIFGRAAGYAKPVPEADREAVIAAAISERGAPPKRKAG